MKPTDPHDIINDFLDFLGDQLIAFRKLSGPLSGHLIVNIRDHRFHGMINFYMIDYKKEYDATFKKCALTLDKIYMLWIMKIHTQYLVYYTVRSAGYSPVRLTSD